MKTLLTFLTILIYTLSFSQIENGMVAHYSLNGDFNDLSGIAPPAVNNGTVFTQDYNGTLNSAIFLNGVSYVTVDNSAIKVSLPLSISIWAKFDSFSSPSVLFASDNLFENYSGYLINTVSNKMSVNFGAALGGANASNRRTFLSDYLLQTNTWYHFVFIIRSALDMDIYVDCVKTTGVYSGSGSTSIIYSTSNSTIGYNVGNNFNPSGTYHNGSIDQVIIWDRELITSEINFLCDTNTTLGLINKDKVNFKIFPNPSNSDVTLEFDELNTGTIEVISTDGKILSKQRFESSLKEKINLYDFDAGVYIINIVTDSGESLTKRIVKE